MPLASLPSEGPIGDMGQSAYQFIDKLSEKGIRYWQVLPLNLIDENGCPYASPSAFGGEPLLISLELLGLPSLSVGSESSFIDYGDLDERKRPVLIEWAKEKIEEKPHSLLKEQYSWLHDLCVFLTLRDAYGPHWTSWPQELLDFNKAELLVEHRYKENYLVHLILQDEFHRQWRLLKEYAHQKNVQIIGDIPIFVSIQSFDSWRWGHLFKRDKVTGLPHVITGAPPDDFSEDGQLWGTLNYDWADPQVHEWWLQRLDYSIQLYDLTRLDHFVGFYHVWESGADAPHARNGQYVLSEGRKLLQKVLTEFPEMPFIAEDLGVITEDIVKLREDFGLPSMRVYQFSLEEKGKPKTGSENEHRPENIPYNSFYYSGTHDNNTLIGWLEDCLQHPYQLNQLEERFPNLSPEKMANHITDLILNSKARCVVFPLQDIFHLPESARINVPGTEKGNWTWRMTSFLWDQEMWDTWAKKVKNTERSYS